jgi:Tfp pilus assembly protein PilN
MIRINLLGLPKPKKGKRAAAVPSVGGEGPNPIIVILILAVVAVAANGWYYTKLNADAKKIAEDKTAAEQENRRLSGVKKAYDDAEKQKDIFRNRVEVIDKLRSNQAGPVNLLNTIGDTINGTDAVWLSSMKEEGNNVNIEGTAIGATAVANLIGNLKKSGAFKNVEIRETWQDEGYKDMQAFQFTLVCEKADQKKS